MVLVNLTKYLSRQIALNCQYEEILILIPHSAYYFVICITYCSYASLQDRPSSVKCS